jgi:hypothetical protein
MSETVPAARRMEAPSHRRQPLRTHVGPCPRTLGDADPARCGFGEVRDALIEVHIPALYTTHNCLCSVIAPGGQALVQTWQVWQNSSAPKRSGAVATSGMSVVTPVRRTPEPNLRLIKEPCLPSSPRPEAIAGGSGAAHSRKARDSRRPCSPASGSSWPARTKLEFPARTNRLVE